MPEVLEIEQTETAQKQQLPASAKGTWILKLPAEVCQREGFAEGTVISLTVRNAGVQTTIIRPSAEVDDFVNCVVKEEKQYFEEIKRLGD